MEREWMRERRDSEGSEGSLRWIIGKDAEVTSLMNLWYCKVGTGRRFGGFFASILCGDDPGCSVGRPSSSYNCCRSVCWKMDEWVDREMDLGVRDEVRGGMDGWVVYMVIVLVRDAIKGFVGVWVVMMLFWVVELLIVELWVGVVLLLFLVSLLTVNSFRVLVFNAVFWLVPSSILTTTLFPVEGCWYNIVAPPPFIAPSLPKPISSTRATSSTALKVCWPHFESCSASLNDVTKGSSETIADAVRMLLLYFTSERWVNVFRMYKWVDRSFNQSSSLSPLPSPLPSSSSYSSSSSSSSSYLQSLWITSYQ